MARRRPRICVAAGTRPNFVKVASLVRALRAHAEFEVCFVHTSQHVDPELSDRFLSDLQIPPPDITLGASEATPGARLGQMIERFEAACLRVRPDVVVVVGDVDSTLACALAANKAGIPVAHVEAGLRSFDKSMPEETNRILTDGIAQWLFTTEESANRNLAREGMPREHIHFVGNTMIDTLMGFREAARRSQILARLGLATGDSGGEVAGAYGVVTLHRPSNVDEPEKLRQLMGALAEIAADVPLVFPVHPRTRKCLQAFGECSSDRTIGGLILTSPMGYLDFMKLMSCAAVVLTDSGGIQEETTVLGIPCLTLRTATERPVTVSHGTNRVIGTHPATIVRECQKVLAEPRAAERIPPLWDGKASDRIADVLEMVICDGPGHRPGMGPPA